MIRFFRFYTHIYTSLSIATDSDIANFLCALDIPALTEAARLELYIRGIKDAILCFLTAKRVGPSGFWIEFFNVDIFCS